MAKRLGGIIGCKYQTSSWHLNGFPPFLKKMVVSHIQRIGCQPEKTTLHGGQSRSWSSEQGKEDKRKSLAAYPPHCSFGEIKCCKISDASTGATQVSVGLASVQGYLRLVD